MYTEFFLQGDEEKQLGLSPQEMMDREKAFIPDLQIQFLENITLPVYKWVTGHSILNLYVLSHINH